MIQTASNRDCHQKVLPTVGKPHARLLWILLSFSRKKSVIKRIDFVLLMKVINWGWATMSVYAVASTTLLWAPSNLSFLMYSHTLRRDKPSSSNVLGCNLHDLYSRISCKGSIKYLIPFGIASSEPALAFHIAALSVPRNETFSLITTYVFIHVRDEFIPHFFNSFCILCPFESYFLKMTPYSQLRHKLLEQDSYQASSPQAHQYHQVHQEWLLLRRNGRRQKWRKHK